MTTMSHGRESSIRRARFLQGLSPLFARQGLTLLTGGATRQAAALRREGVTVGTGALGELTVDFGTYGWFPSMLPSEEAEDSESEGEASRQQ